jgi:hypothetical protein
MKLTLSILWVHFGRARHGGHSLIIDILGLSIICVIHSHRKVRELQFSFYNLFECKYIIWSEGFTSDSTVLPILIVFTVRARNGSVMFIEGGWGLPYQMLIEGSRHCWKLNEYMWGKKERKKMAL